MLWELVLLGHHIGSCRKLRFLQIVFMLEIFVSVPHPLQKLKYMHFRLKLARPDVTYDVISPSHNNQLSA